MNIPCKTNWRAAVASLTLLVLLFGACGVDAVESQPLVHEQYEQDGLALIAVLVFSEPNATEYVNHAEHQRIAELMADMDTVTVSRIYRRLVEEMLRPQETEHQPKKVCYVYLSHGLDELMPQNRCSPQNESLRSLPVLSEGRKRNSSDLRPFSHSPEELMALDREAILAKLDPAAPDWLVAAIASRLAEQMPREQNRDFDVSWQDINTPQARWSQTVVPEPSTIALMALGAAITFKRPKRR